MRAFALFTLLQCALLFTVNAQNNLSALLPMPQKVEQTKGKAFEFDKAGVIECQIADSLFIIEELRGMVAHRTGVELPTAKGKNRITIIEEKNAKPESYTIDIRRKEITIKGSRS